MATTNKRPAVGGWTKSKLFRWQTKALFKHLMRQEKRWKAIADASRSRVYSADEVVAYAREHGVGVSAVVKAAATVERT